MDRIQLGAECARSAEMTEDREQMSDVRGQMTENRKQRTDDRKQRTDDRRYMNLELGMRKAECKRMAHRAESKMLKGKQFIRSSHHALGALH
jgi:hypothetical protein